MTLRFFDLQLDHESELRQAAEDGKKFRGYAMVWGKEAEIFPGFHERFASGAFSDFLGKEPDILAMFNHDANRVLGRTKNGTLTLSEDERGLPFAIDPPDTQFARDLGESVRRKDITGMSINFRATEERFIKVNEKKTVREVVRAELREISICTFPAYPQTSVSLRSLASMAGLDEERLDEILRETPGKLESEVGKLLRSMSASPEESAGILWRHRQRLGLAAKEFCLTGAKVVV